LGGKTRFESVRGALQAVKSDVVLIHDGARPFVTRAVIEGCIASVKAYDSGVCAIDCTDTVAYVVDGKIASVPQRSNLKQLQTPQGFFTEHIRSAYEHTTSANKQNFTDDSSVFAEFCGEPHTCPGSRENIKLTYAEDFTDKAARVGFGVDTHAFGKAQDYIVLAGVKIPSQSGLIAHSDGDVLVHAVMDALLSAAGLRDIGYYFTDSDEKWRGASSMEMLRLVRGILLEQNLRVKNLSIAIQAERPKLANYIDEMKNALSSILEIDPSRIGIGAGTNEGLGYIGEGKGITVNAVTLLEKA
jgi:2-C-methyl-D-erythritol 4-phosphate cytidylyltransferase/2-C-methyl-D-erythritol 2,4-cyclodiphosphate synthase